MKKFIVLFTLVLVFLTCKDNKAEEKESLKSNITVTTTDSLIDLVELTRPLEGILLWKNKVDTIWQSGERDFKIEFSIEAPENAMLKVGNTIKRLVLLPNQNYRLDINDSTTVFSEDNAKGQELLNTFVRPPLNSFTFINKFTQDSTAQLLTLRLNEMSKIEHEKIEELYLGKEIDELFYKLLKNDIDYYYAAGKVSISDYRSRTEDGDPKKDYQKLIDKTIKIFPYTVENKSWDWPDYVMDVEVRRNMYAGLSLDRLQDLYKMDSLNYFVISKIKKNLHKPYREQLSAHFIFNEAKQRNYEKSLVTLFDDFKKEYPNSKFTEYLEKEIDLIREFHIKNEYGFSDTIKIIEDDEINNLSELIKRFKGEKIYIDMWATWCGPCKEEFQYNDKINEILAENNYKKLYISLDKTKDKDKWMSMIKFYNLEGYHHLASHKFFVDFEKNHSTLSNSVAIPQYLIIDETGEILTNNAPRPSNAGELKQYLEEKNEQTKK